MPTPAEVEDLLALGRESRSFEVKGPGLLTDLAFCARVARAVMAMGNLRDGGLVCLGINDKALSSMLPGLTDEQLAQWSDFDNVSDAIARFTRPAATFALQPLELSTGAHVVVLDVTEFEDVPHVCERDHSDILRRGALYVRPRGKPRSEHVPSSEEMRELLELATDKRVRAFIGRLGAVGLLGTSSAPPSGEQEYTGEAAAAWAEPSEVLQGVVTLGHFDVAVRPEPFEAGRVALHDLEELVTESTVRLRGWPVPFTSTRDSLIRTAGWIGQDIRPNRVPHAEAWRLCTSAQFLHRRALATDLRDSAQLTPDIPGATGAVAVWDVLLYLVELAEFGARLSFELGGVPMTFRIALRGMAGRQLISGDWERELHSDYRTASATLEHVERFDATELVADSRAAGVRLAQAILRLFGLNLPDQTLRDWQERVLHPG
ncbi:helix-turn-helix domain-containing protein [Cellulomonas sp. PhB150]|uniref:AlbA family DNA-binding domain-containing protein n=1 Tax=Cellulomonas sp. PhB150 TaxID=2485188 RepID=UPI000F496DBF|nr:hypothetical protein [Cellulomonas sp. PhB150]ROS23723.1 hypothetical protein EDF34_2783 [Cellulomonas sp. PhB150]